MRDQQSADKFEQAGAQAAQVLGKFIHLASEIGREFNTQQTDQAQSTTRRSAEELRDIGEQLRRFRESAGYTLDGFAKAMEAQLNTTDVADKIDAIEQGRSELPAHWSQALAALLAQCDIDTLYGSTRRAADKGEVRVQKLAEIFADDAQLTDLSERDFDRLFAHMQAAYASAKTLLK